MRWQTWNRQGRTWLVIGLLGFPLGCSLPTFRANNDDVPSRYKIEQQHVILHSDVKLKSDDPLIEELKELRLQIGQTLELQLASKQVEVYLFKDEASYQKFLTNHYPGLPPRRAYFVGTGTKLAVYTVWSEQLRVDLRHEFTHGVLHGSLPFVPLWLDEGLAEYFELPTVAGVPREDYLQELGELLENGWRPNLRRLEMLDQVGEMRRLDYAESWAWVHWLLHNNPQTRRALLDYVNQAGRAPQQSLSQRLSQIHPQAERALVEWIQAARQ